MRMRSGLIFELLYRGKREIKGFDTILHFCTYFFLESTISAGVLEGTAFSNTINSLPAQEFSKLTFNCSYFIFIHAHGGFTITIPSPTENTYSYYHFYIAHQKLGYSILLLFFPSLRSNSSIMKPKL
jgi:hypothetical protein